jgi:chromosome segregation protein
LAGDREAVASRREAIEARIGATAALAQRMGERAEWLAAFRDRLRAERDRHAAGRRETIERLEALRRERTDAERRLNETRERAQRAELEAAEVRVRLDGVVETIRREHDLEPEQVVSATLPEEMPAGANPAARARDLERELRLMGPINPLALEEHAALSERHTFLESQLDDVKNSRRELAKVIKAIDAEIIDLFAAAFVDVADNFEKLFATLFPGGTGRLRLTDPDHPLETGIEVEARPSGKNVRRLSLLSGGERSLTALAFLFAVFRSRPSPFYLMDEVEAALDDVNLHRFLDLIAEFRQEAQLVIVSHQKRTMEAADCLYGVTMQSGGSSKVVSEKLQTVPVTQPESAVL